MPEPSPIRQFLLLFLLLLAGMVGGIALADHFAPGSRLAGFIGALSFSLPLLISFSPSQQAPPVEIPPGAPAAPVRRQT